MFSDFDFEAGEWMHLSILVPLYIQPTDFKCSSSMNHQWSWCPDDASRNFNPVNIVLKHVVTLLF